MNNNKVPEPHCNHCGLPLCATLKPGEHCACECHPPQREPSDTIPDDSQIAADNVDWHTEYTESQREPSEAEVEAAARALGNRHSLGWSYMSELDREWERGDARAALRAAGGVR